MLSSKGLWDEQITCPEESYRLWCVVVCDQETSLKRRPWPVLGRSATEKKKNCSYSRHERVRVFCVVLNRCKEECNNVVNSEEIIATTEYLTL